MSRYSGEVTIILLSCADHRIKVKQAAVNGVGSNHNSVDRSDRIFGRFSVTLPTYASKNSPELGLESYRNGVKRTDPSTAPHLPNDSRMPVIRATRIPDGIRPSPTHHKRTAFRCVRSIIDWATCHLIRGSKTLPMMPRWTTSMKPSAAFSMWLAPVREIA